MTSRQTVKAGLNRMMRFETHRVYTYAWGKKSPKPVRRAGVVLVRKGLK
jgi:hypothetical protein